MQHKYPPWRRALLRLGLILIGFELLTTLLGWSYDCYHRQHPSPARQSLRDRFGIILLGRTEDLEAGQILGSPDFLDVLRQQQRRMNLNGLTFKFVPQHYWQRTITEQGVMLLSQDREGEAGDRVIRLYEWDRLPEILTHELKHIQIATFPEERQRALEQAWTLAAGGTHAPYQGAIARQLRSAGRDYDQQASELAGRRQEFAKLYGVVGPYGLLNWEEDLADTLALAESDPTLMSQAVEQDVQGRIAAKLQVAIQYGFLPQDYLSFITLLQARQHLQQEHHRIDWVPQAEAFLQQHPATEYRERICYLAGQVLEGTFPVQAIPWLRQARKAPLRTLRLQLVICDALARLEHPQERDPQKLYAEADRLRELLAGQQVAEALQWIEEIP